MFKVKVNDIKQFKLRGNTHCGICIFVLITAFNRCHTFPGSVTQSLIPETLVLLLIHHHLGY